MKKILITGGAGFIGHNVVQQLKQLGHECFILDSRSDYGFIPRHELNYLFAERSKKTNSHGLNVDICDAKRVNNMFISFHPDIVIHLASFPRQKVVNSNPALASEVMSTGLINLLECSRLNRIEKFVYISSSMVYGDFDDGVTEDAVCNPQGQYGIMKLAGEWLVKDYARRGLFNYTVVRPSAVYGELDVEDRVISKFILAALRNQTLKVNGPGEKLDFTHVSDTAKGIALAAVSNNTNNNTYNITRGQSHSLLDAAKMIIDIAGKGNIEVNDRDLSFPSRGSLDISKARLDFGYSPEVNIDVGFKQYIDWVTESTFWNKTL